MKFTIDELFRIYLNSDVISKLNCTGVLYMHTDDENVVIDSNPENAYRKMKIDELSRIVLPNEIVRFKLVLGANDEFEAQIKDNQIIIPMSGKRNDVEISYIRNLDEKNRAVLPPYLKNLIFTTDEDKIKFTKHDNVFTISFDNNGDAEIDELNRIVIPSEIAESGKVKFKYENNAVTVSAA